MSQQQQQQAQYVPPPGPVLNGGLYTGAPFQAGAPWRNFPATPDATYMTAVNLQSANPPPGATAQIAGSVRPGNNYQELPTVKWFSAQHSLLCQQEGAASMQANPQPTNQQRFSALYHLS